MCIKGARKGVEAEGCLPASLALAHMHLITCTMCMLGRIGFVKTKGDLLSLERNVPAIPRNPARSHPPNLPGSTAFRALDRLPACLPCVRACSRWMEQVQHVDTT